MPDGKYTLDPAASALAGTEKMPIVQSATDKHVTPEQIRDYILQSVSPTELAYINSLTGNVQTAIDSIVAGLATLDEYGGGNVISQASNFSTTNADSNKTHNCTATLTVTLQTAVGIRGAKKTIKNTGGTSVITINTTASQTIDGASSVTLSTQWECITVQSDNANWLIISRI